MQNRFNKVPIDISNGLNNFEVSGGMSYLILLSAPVGANVEIRLDNTESDLIPIKENYAIKFQKSRNIYVTCNAIYGEKIVLGLAPLDSNFEIITSPQVNQIQEIGNLGNLDNFSPALLSALDKIINPYEEETEFIHGDINSYANVTGLKITLDCYKVKIFLTSIATYGQFGEFAIFAMLNNIPICINQRYSNGWNAPNDNNIIVEDCKGKTLEIKGSNSESNYPCYYTIQKFYKKA